MGGQGWDKGGCKAGINSGMGQGLKNVPYSTSAAWKKYVGLVDILADEPCAPRHNTISNNVMCHGATSLVNQLSSTISGWHSVAENNTVCREASSVIDIVI